MLSTMHISSEVGDKIITLLLAPISVAFDYRNKGIGSRLIISSFHLASEMGYFSVFLVGNPIFYNRFGFKASVDFEIINLPGIPDKNVLACELICGALSDICGTIKF